MAILQAPFALINKSAGRVLDAVFGWAVRALFGQTTAREQTHLSFVVGAAVAWSILLLGIVAPKIAALGWTIRLVWVGVVLLIPFLVGFSVATNAPPSVRRESAVYTVLRGFPITIVLAAAFFIMFVSVPVMRLAASVGGRKTANFPLMTDAPAYHEVAVRLCEVLNRHGFSF